MKNVYIAALFTLFLFGCSSDDDTSVIGYCAQPMGIQDFNLSGGEVSIE